MRLNVVNYKSKTEFVIRYVPFFPDPNFHPRAVSHSHKRKLFVFQKKGYAGGNEGGRNG